MSQQIGRERETGAVVGQVQAQQKMEEQGSKMQLQLQLPQQQHWLEPSNNTMNDVDNDDDGDMGRRWVLKGCGAAVGVRCF